jgi:hypothetical protein
MVPAFTIHPPLIFFLKKYVLLVEIVNSLLCSNKYMDHNSIVVDSVLQRLELHRN